MRDQKLNVFGIELDPWQESEIDRVPIVFFRYGGPGYRLQKVGIIQSTPQEKWKTIFWDELIFCRNYREIRELDENLPAEEVMEIVDEFLLRVYRLRSFG